MEGAYSEVTRLTNEMETLNEEIEFLIKLNKGASVSAADKEANVIQISALRENYFTQMDNRTSAEDNIL